jgi:hypothetical protein
MSGSDSDSPWSSEQEESLSETEEWQPYTSLDEYEDAGFFINPNEAESPATVCPLTFAPVNANVTRKTKTLHLHLFELSEALFYIDHPYTAGRYFKASAATVWQIAVKALLALDLPRNVRLLGEDGTQTAAKKAMGMCRGFVVRDPFDIELNQPCHQ